jgi:uncharacterized membrane protein
MRHGSAGSYWKSKTKELNMEICILKFGGAHDADGALSEVINAQGDRHRWLYDVGVVRRPLIGKISISATFDDQPTELKQGELASRAADAGGLTGYLVGSLVGPLHADMAAMEGSARAASAAKGLQDRLMHVDDIKEMLPRGFSALVLIATPEVNDQMVEMFDDWKPEVIRRDVAEEVERRLKTFERKAMASQPQAAS